MAPVALVVDDDAAVRHFVAMVLKSAGFLVVEAANGAAALLALATAKVPIRLVVSDICMEGLDGISLSEKAAEISSDIRFVFMTGFADNERLVSVSSRFPVITKPFVAEALLSCVRLVLAASNTHGPGE
jgi:DNA-binding NtrC family response regulator